LGKFTTECESIVAEFVGPGKIGFVMFIKRGESAARSTDGFEIRFKGRDDLVYIENRPKKEKRTLTIFAEIHLGRVNRVIDARPRVVKHWDSPHEEQLIEEEERKRIVKNVTNALDFLGITYELE
jgi:hypothetical protein